MFDPEPAGRPVSSVMLIAGDPSGDVLAGELAGALEHCAAGRVLQLFGAGGPRMAAAGVELAVDMTPHALIGLAEAVTRYRTFRRLFERLVRLAFERRPDMIVCVDFSGFNRRFAHAIRTRATREARPWRPGIVQYVSPQVWASRPGRALAMARDLDLLLTIFPFEKAWYAARTPGLRVEFVGHPLLDRYAGHPPSASRATGDDDAPARVVLLPGSRADEVRRHLPVMLAATRVIRREAVGATFRVVAADAVQKPLIDAAVGEAEGIETQVGGLAGALEHADLALASTGTVTMECAYFGVPTVAMYRTSWLTYQIGRRIVTVPYIAMPNLIAREEVFPELIQHAATPQRVAAAALELLGDPVRRAAIRARLAEVVGSLGGPGASMRAARAILGIWKSSGESG
jgi:lipid-A-disaccharide synthase